MSKKIVVGFIGVMLVVGLFGFGAVNYASAQNLTFAQIIEILIVANIIPADKADAARAVVANPTATPSTATSATAVNACPPDALTKRGQNGSSFTCFCSLFAATAGVPGTGGAGMAADIPRISGTNTYTDDSNICRAAKHAGLAIPGNVTYTIQPGQSSYTSSTRNSITSLTYGPWVGSYSFANTQAQTALQATNQSGPLIAYFNVSPINFQQGETMTWSGAATMGGAYFKRQRAYVVDSTRPADGGWLLAPGAYTSTINFNASGISTTKNPASWHGTGLGLYEIIYEVEDMNGKTASMKKSVTITAPQTTTTNTPSITVFSPNGGESYKVGDTMPIRWSSANVPSNTSVMFQLSYFTTNATSRMEDGMITYTTYPSATNSSFQWTIPMKYASGYVPGGFRVRAILVGPNIPSTNPPEDVSDQSFMITAPQATVDNKPVGYLDNVSCSLFNGWAYDPDDTSAQIGVHFYAGGRVGEGGVFVGSAVANVSRPDVNSTMGVTGNHGFSFTTPPSLHDGATHAIYAYGINSNSSTNLNNSLLTQSPLSMSGCITPEAVAPAATGPTINSYSVSPASVTRGANVTFSGNATTRTGYCITKHRAIVVDSQTPSWRLTDERWTDVGCVQSVDLTGTVSTAVSPYSFYEGKTSYEVIWQIKDSGGGDASRTQTVTVNPAPTSMNTVQSNLGSALISFEEIMKLINALR